MDDEVNELPAEPADAAQPDATDPEELPEGTPTEAPAVKADYHPVQHERVRRVVDYYLAMPKPSYQEALIRGGGYTKATANSNAHKFFRRPEVVAYLEERRKDLCAKTGVTQEALVQRLKMLAFGDLSKFIKVNSKGELDYDFTGATEDELRLINELTVDSYKEGRGADARDVKKFKFAKADTLRALELLGRIMGVFKDKTEVSGEVSLVERLQRGRDRIRLGKPAGRPGAPATSTTNDGDE
jgi:phage terminase small subunit